MKIRSNNIHKTKMFQINNGFFLKCLNKCLFKFSNLMDVTKKEHTLLNFIRDEYLKPFQLPSELEKLLEDQYIEDVAIKG